ncbi:MAG: FIST N domain protein [Syntrophaceae bacterium PtaU1.Bin231]|jgi:hypothetical protein|nr:MAG: FIST N domain protein [Syntrophaceae bacterium PtaU1.Bin231]
MQVEQRKWSPSAGWKPGPPGRLGTSAQLVFLFGSTAIMREKRELAAIAAAYPGARLLGCSTAGEICCTQFGNDTLVLTAVSFERTGVQCAKTRLERMEDSFSAGWQLAQSLPAADLAHVFVLSDGLKINGSELVKGLTARLPAHVSVTGGLAADGARFSETYVLLDGEPEKDAVAVLGLYGSALKVGCASFGGWDPFGPERLITRSDGNVLYELDGKSALGLYKKYLGEHAQGLPSTGLLFPLSLRIGESERGVVRTILSVSETDQSLTFAGDVPEGAYARLMMANFDRLIDGAATAAASSLAMIGSPPELAILISCVGRKLILQQRVEEEIESVRDILGGQAVLAGFYSYGEISPFAGGAPSELHNQTMTITAFSEDDRG